MSTERKYLALDLGAESGRGALGKFDGKKLTLQEVHRFPNGPVRVLGRMHWNVLSLFDNLKQAVGGAVSDAGGIDSIAVDTWGVDFGLLAKDGSLVGNPVHYRDPRTDGMMERAFEVMPKEEIFEHTGLQFMQINTVFQLYSMVVSGSSLLGAADKMLMMPSLFNFLFTTWGG